MIVREGKIVVVDDGAGSQSHFVRRCDSPGLVSVTRRNRGSLDLPGNKAEAVSFIRAYWRAVIADISYVKVECEDLPDDAIRELELS